MGAMRAVAVVPGRHASIHVRDDAVDPLPAEGEAVVRVLEAGVCGTDVEINEGVYGEAPAGSPFLILGHENLGVVESSPSGASVKPGDLVVATNRRPCAAGCHQCAKGHQDMCVTGHFQERGIRGLHGFMSERYSDSPAYLIPLAAQLRSFAVLVEPLSVVEKGIDHAFRMQERLSWEPRTAVVLGAGPIGILAAAALRLRGLEVTVAALEPEGSARDALLREAGIAYVSTASTPLGDLGRRLGQVDLVFEATGATAVVFPAMCLLGPDGVCILSSVTGGSRTVEADLATWNREMVLGNRVVFGTVNSGRQHYEAAARDLEIVESRLPGWLGRLITRRLPFTDAAAALVRRPDDIKTVLVFH
jgi:threonine dehydrogenase-like Zn-dependent dehydrogenase